MNKQLIDARKAVLAIFFINGTLLASWVPHIPLVQADLGIGEGLLGIALLGMAAGALGSMPLSGWACAKYGSGAVTRFAALIFCLALPLPILAPNFISLISALALFGAGNGAMDVAMNAQAVAVEKRVHKPIMSSFHGFWSLGGLTGAGLGGLALGNGMSSLTHVACVSGAMLVAIAVTTRYFLPKEADAQKTGAKFVRPRGALLGLGALAFLILAAEGAMLDWSAVYLKGSLSTGAGVAATGYAVFSLAMAIGRLTGDKIVTRVGPSTVTRLSALMAALGLGIALALQHPVAALIGFAFMGMGLSNLVPILFSAAGKAPDMPPSAGIAAVATTGYMGLLAGPPVIGFIAELFTLPIALGGVALALFIVSIFAGVTRAHHSTVAPPTPCL